MHWIKQYMRGYNQAELLAGQISGYCGKPLLKGFKRGKFTRPQYRLTKEQRSDNISGSFRLDPAASAAIKGKTVLLVDDVSTTCSTIEECSKTLVNAGAGGVYALTFAKD
jgi:predicted amidophosphoribosyltransferase